METKESFSPQVAAGPIGIFDSGYGGLTILTHIQELMPEYDFLYLGDNARTPYGTRSFQVVYDFTLECVTKLFNMGCHLIILACNTASAKALRNIQQRDIPSFGAQKRVLGIITPTAESVGNLTSTRHIGLLATPGTVKSMSYPMEISKIFPDIKVSGEACPIWVPLVENNEYQSDGADFFIKRHVDNLMKKDPFIDTIILGCTHYPILIEKIRKYVPDSVKIIAQGEYVASSLQNYLKRHPCMEEMCSKNGETRYLTTESVDIFLPSASIFLKHKIEAETISL
ncbi:MAG TPA: glutamate racemase [Bacteroidaceae bacterium]|nr:glutamate racemase [Bacteroidaceae bacterium]